MSLRTGTETLVAVAMLLSVAIVIGFLGQRIRNGERRLIAGYDPESVADESAVGHRVGTTVVTLGGVTGGYAIGMLFLDPGLGFWLSYVGIVLVAITVLQVWGRSGAD